MLRNMPLRWPVLATALTGAASVSLAQSGRQADVIRPDTAAPVFERQADARVSLLPDGRAHYYVKMEGEPAARVFERVSGNYYRGYRFLARGGAVEARATADQIGATQANAHSRTLDAQQLALAGQLEAQFGATVVFRGQTALNGLAVLLRPDQVDAVRALPGVVSVAPIRPKVPMGNTSVEYMGTRNFWDPARLNGLGQGVGVAVIDTGIDFVHSAFGGGGVSPTGAVSTGYTANATSIAGGTLATTFPTAKVVWGWDLVGDAYNGGLATPPNNTPAPDPNPMDVFGHGTSCASLVAAFGTLNTAANGLFAGSTYPGPWDNTTPQITGTGNNIRTSPGIAPGASLYALRVFGNAGATFVSSNAVDIATAVRIWQLGPPTDPLPPILANLTGAAAIPRTPVLAICSMSLGDDAGLDYPGDPDTDSALAANAAGMSVIAAAGNANDNYYITGTPAATTSVLSVAASYNGQGAQVADSIASYSSRGPRPSDSKLKPDITGPAESVSTANRNSGGGNTSFNGTSSATPHVAGAMALLRQYRPGYTAEEYKALMMNAVRVDPRVTAAGLFYGISRIGVGRVTLNPTDGFPTALAMSTDPDAPVNVTWGLLNIPVGASQTFTKTVRVVNKENLARTFNVAFSSTNFATTPGATYSLPDGATVNVPANGEATLRVQLDVVGSALRHARDAQVAVTQGTPARNFVSEASGRLTFTEVGGPGHSMRVNVHAVVRPTSSLAATPTNLTPMGNRTGLSTLTLGGSGINTGPNTSVTANNPADIVSQAKAFELQYVNETHSGTIFEQSEIRYVGVTTDFAVRANPFDPNASNNQSAVVVFGVAMHQDYAAPSELGTQVRILIDRTRTGTTNIVVRNYTQNTGTQQNVFLTGTSATAGNVADGVTVTSTGYFANITTGVANNTMNTNLAMLPVNLRQLGLTAATTRFNYKVQVTRHDALGYTVNSETPWLTYDVSRPGVDASSPTGTEPFVFNGQSGTNIPVAVNLANYQTNGSLGALLFYPHNAPGARTQIVTVSAPAARLAITGFTPTSGPVGTVVTITGSGFTGTTGVSMRGTPCPFSVVNDTTISATIPAGAPSAATLMVTTPAGSATTATRFVVTP